MSKSINSEVQKRQIEKPYVDFWMKNESDVKAYLRKLLRNVDENCIEEVFLNTMEGFWQTYLLTRGSYTIQKNDVALLYGVCRNQALTFLTNRKNRYEKYVSRDDEDLDYNPDAEWEIQMAEDSLKKEAVLEKYDSVKEVMSHLPAKYEATITLSEEYGMSMEEIAQELGMSSADVAKNTKCRGMKILRSRLGIAA